VTARRASSSRHADRGFTCACGRTVYGNGGTSSHKRACRTYKVARYIRLGQGLMAGRWDATPFIKPWFENDFENLRRELLGVDL
jgi:hypothetical protein